MLSVDQENTAAVVGRTMPNRDQVRLAGPGTGLTIDFLRRGPSKEAERAGLGEIEEELPAGSTERPRSVGTGQEARQRDSEGMKERSPPCSSVTRAIPPRHDHSALGSVPSSSSAGWSEFAISSCREAGRWRGSHVASSKIRYASANRLRRSAGSVTVQTIVMMYSDIISPEFGHSVVG